MKSFTLNIFNRVVFFVGVDFLLGDLLKVSIWQCPKFTKQTKIFMLCLSMPVRAESWGGTGENTSPPPYRDIKTFKK